MSSLNFSAPFELKFVAETGVFEGYASVFNVTDKVNDKIVRGAFKKSLEKFSQSGVLPAMLWQHNTSEPIGAWIEMYEDEHGLFVKGELFVNDLKTAKEAYKLLQAGVVNGLSIGYQVVESFYEGGKGGVRVLSQVDLHEVSLVTFPANDFARVSSVNKLSFGGSNSPSERELEAILRNGGLSRRQAKGVVALGYKGLCVDAGVNQVNGIKELCDKILKATDELKYGHKKTPPR